MDKSLFCVLENHIPRRIGLSEDQVRDWRLQNLTKGTDWERIGRWVKWSEDGVRRLEAFHQVQLNPAPKPPEWRDAEVVRCNFPNTRIIECREFDDGPKWHVAIKPEWHDLFRIRMRLKIKVTDGERLASTRKPKARYVF